MWGESPQLWEELEQMLKDEPSTAKVKQLTEDILDASTGRRIFYFDKFKEQQSDRFIAVPQDTVIPRMWLVGDLHGDLLGLLTVLVM